MVLITGMAGHSGKWLADRLSRERYAGAIRCVLRPSSDTRFLDNAQLDISKCTGDLADPGFLDRHLKGVDTVIHIASIKFSTELMKAAIRNGVARAILVHTTGRFSKFKSAADEYKRIEDGILGLRDKIAVTILRPTMIYGSSRDQNMYKLVDFLYRHRFFPIFGSGNNLMQPVHARDLGNAYYDVLMNPDATENREYNLSGKEPIKYKDLVRTVSRALGKQNILVPVPMTLSLLAAKAYNRLSANAQISVEQVMRMSEDKAFAHDAAARDFGYEPLGFDEGIQEEVQEYLETRGNSIRNTTPARA